MGAHLLLSVTVRSASDLITDIFYTGWTLVAFCACVLRYARVWRTPASWLLLSSSMLLWSAATALQAWMLLVMHASPNSATFADFLYFFYGVPILLAISSPTPGQSDSTLFWLDGLQAAAVGFLAYIALFEVLPFSGAALRPIGAERLVWIYDWENVMLFGLALGRLLISPPRTGERRFLGILTVYLALYGFSAGIYNHLFVFSGGGGTFDALLDIPFAALALAAYFVPDPQHRDLDLRSRKPMELLVDNARPALLGLVLVLLSAGVEKAHFKTAVVVVIGAFMLYGVRSSLLQSRFVQTQLALEDARDRLQALVLQDGLTGIANRRCFDQRLSVEQNRAVRTLRPLSLLMIDIDHFKKLNDTYGHQSGDECLVGVAKAFGKILNRPADLLARYGGEEFTALLPETDANGAQSVAARLQDALRDLRLVPGTRLEVTVSIGATTWENDKGVSPDQMLETADRALYSAKQNGRNRIEFLPLEVMETDQATS